MAPRKLPCAIFDEARKRTVDAFMRGDLEAYAKGAQDLAALLPPRADGRKRPHGGHFLKKVLHVSD